MSLVIVKDIDSRAGRNGAMVKFVLAKCTCGKEFEVSLSNSKRQKTCGCIKIKHNMTKHRMYNIWSKMIDRTENINCASYNNYGGRGISVCERWLDINNFIEDMYKTFKDGLSIDRIDVNGNYEPSNCRWATRNTQARNTRLIMTTNTSGYRGVGYKKSHKKWEARITINRKTITIGRFYTQIEAAKAYDLYVINNTLEHPTNFN